MRSYDEIKRARDARIAARRKPRTAIKKSPMKKRGPSKASTERAYGSDAFRAHVHASPCLWCGITRPIEQAHFGKHAMGKKNDWTQTGPLCGAFTVGDYSYPGCHAAYDRRAPEAYWFAPEDRHTLIVRQQRFVANWTKREQEWL